MNKIKTTILVGAGVLGANLVNAQTAMEDFATAVAGQGTTLAGYMATAATGGLAVLALILGVRYVIRIFRSVK